MSKATIVFFIVDDDFSAVYFTTPEKYSNILDKHNIVPERVKYKTISIETIMLIIDNQKEYIVRL